MLPIERILKSASDIYNEVDFKTDSLFNDPAPPPWVSFLIGGVSSVIAIAYWIRRVIYMRKELKLESLTHSLRFRLWISAAIDNDSAGYTICKMAAQSFLFLGGLQLDYEIAFAVMLGFFAAESSCDSLRVLIAFREASSIDDVVVTSSNLKTNFRSKVTQLSPSNVYEDLSRGKTIVLMVFITQCLLIAFVVADVFQSSTTNCRDGSSNCPVVGTFGSWGLYVLGIFMACVYLLGPKTSFGQSEQNPAFWLQLLLVAKTGTKCTWYDPVTDTTKSRLLRPSDYRIWIRFLQSFLINGVGFHILVHALPIQVAAQSSLTGVVFRAVGMMYLVDLDDTPGYTLTLVDEDITQKQEEEMPSKKPQDVKPMAPAQEEQEQQQEQPDEGALAAQAEHIIAEAQAKLDALAEGQGIGPVKQGTKLATGALVLAGAAGLTAAGEMSTDNDNGTSAAVEEGNGAVIDTGDDAGGE